MKLKIKFKTDGAGLPEFDASNRSLSLPTMFGYIAGTVKLVAKWAEYGGIVLIRNTGTYIPHYISHKTQF
jgi:hypothetical protein